jgi:hypothetical protein
MSSTGRDFPEPDGCGAIGRWPFGLDADDVERPHVVVTVDTRTGGATFSGPYRTAIGALCAADVEYQVDRDQGGKGELTFHVATLNAPIGSDDLFLLVDDADAGHDPRPLTRALARLTTAAERTIRRRARLTAGAVAVSAGALLPGMHGSVRRGRMPRYRHLLGRGAR